MLRFRVRFPLGVYHAVSVTTTPDAEWPPNPLRLIGALLAAAHGRSGQSLDHDRELIQRLCEAPAPLVQGPQRAKIGEPAGAGDAYMLRGATRWVPRNYVKGKEGLSPRNLGRERAEVTKAGVAIGDVALAFVWPDLDLPTAEVEQLKHLAEDIAFLGTTRSPVIVSVDTEGDISATDTWLPRKEEQAFSGSVPVRVPGTTTLTAFDRREEARSSSSSAPENAGMVPAIPTGQTILYEPPAGLRDGEVDPHWWGEMLVLAVDDEASELIPRVAATYLFARAVRVALLGSFEDAGSGGEAPPALRGRGSEPHCAIVPLPMASGPHPDWRIKGVAFVLPNSERAPRIHEEREQIVQGLVRLAKPGPDGERRFVQIPGAGRVWLSEPNTRQATQWTLRTSLYAGSSRTWQTVTPVVHSHWRKDSRGGLQGQVEADCRHVGLPAPEMVESLRGRAGMLPAKRVPQEWRSLLGGPSGHLRITFPEPVRGPLLLGRARHFGLGLCLPADQRAGGSR